MNGGGIFRSYRDQDVGGLDVHVLDLRQVDECGSSAETREKTLHDFPQLLGRYTDVLRASGHVLHKLTQIYVCYRVRENRQEYVLVVASN